MALDGHRVRLADLIAALSLATDLGMGQRLEHQLGVCLAALGLASMVGCSAEELRDVYYVSLLEHVGCTASSAEMASWAGGNDLALRRDAIRLGSSASPIEATGHFVRHLAEDRPLPERVLKVAGMLAAGSGRFAVVSAMQCEAASHLAGRLGLNARVCAALEQLDERWDGKGQPGKLAGEAICRPQRIVRVAHDLVVNAEALGGERATKLVARRRERAYDPDIADVACASAMELLGAAGGADMREQVLDAEPRPALTVSTSQLGRVARAFAEFTDLKVPCLVGHSISVSELAAPAAAVLDCDREQVVMARTAGLVHDLGRIAVANGIWEKAGRLGVAEYEQVRLHPYYTERVLARSVAFAALAVVAGAHHERLDGSGYHRGVGAALLDPVARVLAAADCYDAMTHDRPHRPRLTDAAIAAELRAEVAAGRLDKRAVNAVLDAADVAPVRIRQGWPADLTEREVDVLRLLARGHTNKQIAAQLVMAEKTAGHHVEHIYEKAGISTRAGAALFAMQHDLIA